MRDDDDAVALSVEDGRGSWSLVCCVCCVESPTVVALRCGHGFCELCQQREDLRTHLSTCRSLGLTRAWCACGATASVHCTDCAASMCDRCVEKHQRSPRHAWHSIVPISLDLVPLPGHTAAHDDDAQDVEESVMGRDLFCDPAHGEESATGRESVGGAVPGADADCPWPPSESLPSNVPSSPARSDGISFVELDGSRGRSRWSKPTSLTDSAVSPYGDASFVELDGSPSRRS